MASKTRRSASTVITEARAPRSEDLARRQRNYLILMAFRVACIVAMFAVPGIWRWLLLAGAALLPGIAVIIANNIDQRTTKVTPHEAHNKALPQSSEQVVPGEVVDDLPPVTSPLHEQS